MNTHQVIERLTLTAEPWNADPSAELSEESRRLMVSWLDCQEDITSPDGDVASEAEWRSERIWIDLIESLERDGVIDPSEEEPDDWEPPNCFVPGLGWTVV